MIDLNVVANKLKNSTFIGYDTETNGLDWRTCHAVGYVLTFILDNKPDTVYLPIRHPTANLDVDQVNRLLQEEIPGLDVVMHNAAFDLKFAAKEGIHFNNKVFDTQIMAALLDEHSKSFSLDFQTKKYGVAQKVTSIYEYIAQKFGLSSNDKGTMGHFWKLDGDDPLAVEYACGDGDSTVELFNAMIPKIQDEELGRIWDVETRLTSVLHEMSWRGMKIDEERLHLIKKQAEQFVEQFSTGLPADLNFKSPLQMEKLFRDNGITEFERTRTGRLTFGQAWLSGSELGRRIIAVRKWRTLLDSFINPTIDRHCYRGRLHTNYNQLKADDYGTISGRISATDPNVLNYPSPKRQPDQGKLFRQIFVADDGRCMAEADYNQAEPRLVGHYAKIKAWIEGYKATPPIDAHSSVATMTGLPRQHGKTVSMALITGAGTDKIIEMLGIDYDKGQAIVRTYHRGVPEIRDFQKYAARVWTDRRFVRSILGRKYRLDDSRFAYRALSRIIQGSNADICKLALVQCNEGPCKEYGVQLLNSIYDSIIWQFDTGDRPEEANKAMCRAMTDLEGVNLRIPMVVDLGTGFRWSDCGE